MMTEDDFAGLFERAVQDLDPAVHSIVAGAEQRGRRLRARRRARMALGSALVIAAVAAVVLAAGVPQARPAAGPVAAGAAGTGASGKPGASPGSGSKHPPATKPPGGSYPAGSIPKLAPGGAMPLVQMLRTMRRLLPAGSAVSHVQPLAYSPADSTGDTLEADYNDGKGAVDVQITVDPSIMFDAPLACPKPLWPNEGPRPAGALPVSCAMRTLPDGSIERDAVYNADSYGFYAYSIYDMRPDGVTVDIEVGNGILHGLPQVDRARPPGSMPEWEAIAENPAWHLKKGWHLVQ